jgi:hypothetical protein
MKLPDPNGVRAGLERLNAQPLPDLGDPRTFFRVEMSEPEINAIYAAVAFVESECAALVKLAGGDIESRFWRHYGPTLNALSARLSRDFDGK